MSPSEQLECTQYEDRIPPVAKRPFSLRLGHPAALTCHRQVIHYRRAAPLPPLGKGGKAVGNKAYQPIFSILSETPIGFMLRSTSTTLMRVWPAVGVISVSMSVSSTAPYHGEDCVTTSIEVP